MTDTPDVRAELWEELAARGWDLELHDRATRVGKVWAGRSRGQGCDANLIVHRLGTVNITTAHSDHAFGRDVDDWTVLAVIHALQDN